MTNATKYDDGKTNWCYLLIDFKPELEEIAKVFKFGASKYGRDNKFNPQTDSEQFMNPAFRHLLEDGLDEESGLSHKAHAVASILISMYHDKKGS